MEQRQPRARLGRNTRRTLDVVSLRPQESAIAGGGPTLLPTISTATRWIQCATSAVVSSATLPHVCAQVLPHRRQPRTLHLRPCSRRRPRTSWCSRRRRRRMSLPPSKANGSDVAAAELDDVWEDVSDSPRHAYTLDREWTRRQNQFQKMGYRDGITEGQKDSAQEGFNVGFRQSVNVGYKWGLVRGVASALASLPDSLKEKLVPDVQCRGKLQGLHSSVQEISADDALQMFHESICQSNRPSEGSGSHVTSTSDGATESNRMKSLSKDLVLLLHECSDIKVSEEVA